MAFRDLYDKVVQYLSNLSLAHKIIIGAAFIIITFSIIAYFSLGIMQNFPNSADEYAYVFQARNLARFQVYAPVHPPAEDGFRMQSYFYFVHIGENEGKYYGRFPFGYSLLMVPMAWIEALFGVDLYWVTNTIFGALTLLLLYFIMRRFFDVWAAVIAVIVGLCNPWFLFTTGSFFSHITCAFFIGLFMYVFLIAIDEEAEKRRRIIFIISGLCFGFSIIVRFLDPLAYILPAALIYLAMMIKDKKLAIKRLGLDLGFFMIGAGFFAIVLLLYNKALTGHFFLTAYQYFNPNDSGTRFIFQVLQDGKEYIDFSRIRSVGYEKRTVPNVRLMFQWFYWAYALFLLPVAVFMNRKNAKRLIIIAGLFIMPFLVILLYMLYGGPPMNQYGPRYYFSYFVPITILIAVSISYIAKGKFRLLSIPLVAVLVFLSIGDIAEKKNYVYEEVRDRRNLFRTIKELNIKNAVVFLLTPSGSMYNGDLTRNNLDFSNDVILAQNLGGAYSPMIRYYKDREFYEYQYISRDKLGKMHKLITKPDGSYYRELADIDLSKYKPGQNGLLGEYYTGHNFQDLKARQVDPFIDFDWKQEKPIDNLGADHYSIRWEALIKIDRTQIYTFYTVSDDGVRLFIDNSPVIENWTAHPATENSAPANLTKGYHLLRLEYYEDAFDAKLQLMYSAQNIEKQIIPERVLFVPEKVE